MRKAADQLVGTLKEQAKRMYGFTDEELRRSDLRGFNERTKSARILRLVRMAHYRGKLMGLSLVWSELSQPFEVRRESGDYDWQPQPAISWEDFCRWSGLVRKDAARDGFCETELNGGRDFTPYTHSARITRLCDLAYTRGVVRGVRFAEEMSRTTYTFAGRAAKQTPARRLAS